MEYPIKDLIQRISKNNIFITISGSNNSGKTTLIRILKKKFLEEKIETIIPFEFLFLEKTLEEEMKRIETNQDKIEEIIKILKLKKFYKKNITEYSKQEIVLSQLTLSILKKPKVLLIDDITSHIQKKEREYIINFLIDYQKNNSCTIVLTSRYLEETMKSDYLYILNEGEIILCGKPLEILEKDNILNKVGLSIPFMVDLSVKLRDYELIDSLELDMDRMVNTLWK